MLPFEFTIKGPPISVQTRKRSRLISWKQQVKSAAHAELNPELAAVNDEICVTITYYYDGASPDVDNIIKPIIDALKGVVFIDDRQVVEAKARKKSINGSYKIRGVSSTLLMGFASGYDFVHVKVIKANISEVLD